MLYYNITFAANCIFIYLFGYQLSNKIKWRGYKMNKEKLLKELQAITAIIDTEYKISKAGKLQYIKNKSKELINAIEQEESMESAK